ncbi:MAG: PH domain-containing protein [Candidatus Nanohaloarchaea archaeon]
MEEFDWLSLDEDEEFLWSGNPKIQRIIGFEITDYVVTNQGIYRKSGIFSRSVKKIGFEKVQNISFSQGILGKAFGYGTINISTAGSSGTEMRFASVEDPKKVQEMINKRIKDQKDDEGEGDSQREILEQILEQLEQINQKLD